MGKTIMGTPAGVKRTPLYPWEKQFSEQGFGQLGGYLWGDQGMIPQAGAALSSYLQPGFTDLSQDPAYLRAIEAATPGALQPFAEAGGLRSRLAGEQMGKTMREITLEELMRRRALQGQVGQNVLQNLLQGMGLVPTGAVGTPAQPGLLQQMASAAGTASRMGG